MIKQYTPFFSAEFQGWVASSAFQIAKTRSLPVPWRRATQSRRGLFSPEDNTQELEIPGEEEDDNESDDDEFCILEHPDKEPDGMSCEFVIKSLTDEPVSMVENHFSIPVSWCLI